MPITLSDTHPSRMQEMFSNPFFHALHTEHASLAIGASPALRYPADVIPFAAIADSGPEAILALAQLMVAGETLYVTADSITATAEMEYLKELPCLQYQFPPEDLHLIESNATLGPEIRDLSAIDSPAMVALTDLAFPGFFRPRAHLLGPFYGMHVQGQLVAMAGTRVCLPGYREISVVCTHPAHTGQGYAAALTRHALRANAAAGVQSFLHVLTANHRAIALYERLGFRRTIPIVVHQLRRR